MHCAVTRHRNPWLARGLRRVVGYVHDVGPHASWRQTAIEDIVLIAKTFGPDNVERATRTDDCAALGAEVRCVGEINWRRPGEQTRRRGDGERKHGGPRTGACRIR